jgi:hypothetical protein
MGIPYYIILLHAPYISVRWPYDGRKDRNMSPLEKLNLVLCLTTAINNLFIVKVKNMQFKDKVIIVFYILFTSLWFIEA